MIRSIVIVIIFAPGWSAGLSCFTCSETDFNGDPSRADNCFITSSSTSSLPCSELYSYCRTHFSFQDGIAVSVNRMCAQGQSDHDFSTNEMPNSNKCTSRLTRDYRSTDTTNCYYHCNSTDNCNYASVSTLKMCDSDCSSQGFCDYISGKCACNSGYIGQNCVTRVTTLSHPIRMCVQCNSATDKGCINEKEGAPCPGNENYCSSVETSIFELERVVRTTLIRGCISNFVATDECKFTSIHGNNGIINSGYREYTCYSTCDTDNCNTNRPNGILDENEKTRLYCYQCISASDCRGSLQECPIESTYCKTTVSYIISEVKDHRYKLEDPSSYELLSVERACATSKVSSECKESSIGNLSFKNVTCQESCQDDGCNTGWPARPKCIQCSSSRDNLRYGNDVCLKYPPMASDCTHPYHKHCAIKDVGLEKGTRDTLDGYPRHIKRYCSRLDIGIGCTKSTIRDKAVQTCNYTCSTDGCNVGSGSANLHSAPNFFFTFLVFWISEIYRL